MYEAIKQFLKPPSEGGAYTDERLAMLLAHAEDGKLSYSSCCCITGAATADHALTGSESFNGYYRVPHYKQAQRLPNAAVADSEFCSMGYEGTTADDDEQRRAKLIPLIREEMERRAQSNTFSERGITEGASVSAL